MWGVYLWKLRLLLFIPIVLYGIWIFTTGAYPSYYLIVIAIYTLICSIILHKMEKKEKKEKQ
ncbi:hypothetical protein ABE132_11175 [Peribacillus simplex]|uniref:hypothetical protein n=1 Tax=Peribacillus simplex TaxID=1478 RepID=UPI003D2974C1